MPVSYTHLDVYKRQEAVGALCSLRCVDVRLAVRVLIGVLRRPDVLRFDDEAVRSGLMRVHGPRSRCV